MIQKFLNPHRFTLKYSKRSFHHLGSTLALMEARTKTRTRSGWPKKVTLDILYVSISKEDFGEPTSQLSHNKEDQESNFAVHIFSTMFENV